MTFDDVIAHVVQVIDATGVAAMVIGVATAAVIAASRLGQAQPDIYKKFRQGVGRSILLGLELLVASDIIRTITNKTTLTSVAVLAGIVLIRTFLSFSLELEISGQWPWQHKPAPPSQGNS